MAIIIKIEPDLKEFNRKVEQSVEQLKGSLQKARVTKPVDDAFSQIERNARSTFGRVSRDSRSAFDQVAQHARSAGSAIANMAQTALGVFGGNLLTGGISKVVNLLTGGAEAGIAFNSQIENLRIRFIQLTGDTATANRELDILKKLADSTPFEFPDLAKSALTMQAMGFSTQEVITGMRGVVDAAARAGGGAENLNTIALVLGQIRSRSNLATEDLNQLAQRGLPAFEILAKAANVTEDAFRQALERGEVSGKVAAGKLVEAFLSRADIAGTSAKIAETLDGKLSTLTDRTRSLLGKVAEDTHAELKKSIDSALELLSGPTADKLAERLKPVFAAPVELLNSALGALKTGDLKQFGIDQAKAALSGISSVLESGLRLVLDSVVKPALEGISKLISDTFEKLKQDVLNAIKSIRDALPSLKVPDSINPFKTGSAGGGDTTGITISLLQTPQQPGETKREALRRIIEESRKKGPTQLDQIIAGGSFGVNTLIDRQRSAPLPVFAPFGELNEPIRVFTDVLPLTGDVTGTATVLQQIATAKKEVASGVDAFRQASSDVGPLIRQAAKQASEFQLTMTDSVNTFFDALIVGGRGVSGAFSSALSVVRQSAAQIFSQGINNLFFGGGTPGSTVAGGSTSGGGGFLGGLVGKLLGGGGGGFNLGNLFRTAPFNPNASNSIGVPGSISTISARAAGIAGLGLDPNTVLGRAAGATAGGFSAGSLLGGLAGLAPILGIGLGSSLGGSSTAGKVIGGIGGGVLGAAAGILATGSTLGLGVTTALLLSNPFTIAAGLGLLVGSVLLGRASQRKKDEKSADEIWMNELTQIRQLIAQVNSDRIDGQEALAVAAQLRSQTIAGLNQIKTKSVRDSRLTNQLRDLDNGVVAELRRAVERQATRQRVGPQLVPEFATGGRVPGIDQGFDSVIARLRPGEAVLNQSQIALLGGVSALRRARVPGFAEGGQITASTPSASPSSGGPMTIIFEDVTIDAEGIFVKGARTSKGERVAVQIQRNARKNGRA